MADAGFVSEPTEQRKVPSGCAAIAVVLRSTAAGVVFVFIVGFLTFQLRGGTNALTAFLYLELLTQLL